MNHERYSLSFTTGSLFHRESVKMSELYLDFGKWDKVRDMVIAENLMQSRTQNTLKRTCREVISRLKTLTPEEVEFLAQAPRQDQLNILWISVCRRYTFIADFAVDVLKERYITLKKELSHNDFDIYFNQKSQWHPELNTISPVTRNKLRQVLFKMLKEAELLSPENQIIPAVISQNLLNLLPPAHGEDILFFPVFESDLKRKMK